MSVASFEAILATDKRIASQFQEVSAQYIQEARDLGIRVTLDDLKQIGAVRLHALTGSQVADTWIEEATHLLPEFQRHAAEQEAREALGNPHHDQHAEELAKLAGMKPEDRLNAYRSMGADTYTQGSATKRNLSASERDQAIREINTLPQSMRVAKARELGLE